MTEAITPPDETILEAVLGRLPAVRALYLFGSRATGGASVASDLDLAVAFAGKADPVTLWEAASDLTAALGMEVDLVDLLAAPTTVQYEIVTKGRRLLATDEGVDRYEFFVMREGLDFRERTQPLVDDIMARGSVYG